MILVSLVFWKPLEPRVGSGFFFFFKCNIQTVLASSIARVRASAVFLCTLEVFVIGTCAAFSRFVLANRWGHHVQNVG